MDLSAFFDTKDQASDFSSRLSTISDYIYKTDFNLEKVLIDNLGLEKKEKFMILFRDYNIETTSQATLKDFFAKIQTEINKLPQLSITLAFEPNQETLKFLNEWFMLNLKRQFVFDISVNKTLIAGIVINYNGKFKDYSIRPRFEKIVAEVLASGVKVSPQVLQPATKIVS